MALTGLRQHSANAIIICQNGNVFKSLNRGYNQGVSLFSSLTLLFPLRGMKTSSPGWITGGAGSSALTGVRQHSANKLRATVATGSVRVSNSVLTPVYLEKRVKVFIEKTIAALKALIALLELISQFIN
ncbi:hypothetical protein CBU34_20485 [Salmonella enterica subsp. enterica serovar Muenchen]|nr:hypothetical protein [Salmonella enterica subsp. enterica serovar Oranienburg]ECF6946411.1 hypothetical protein [Salmonella enterica subsp. diarizonae]ECT3983501.1 hypothetical protein [Salmonella enterica subsp. houtenae serovar 53:z4,z23:-]ECT8844052.1 hypothetical protein [Salmonella enterica subsp. enterica serovar Muenchen]